MISSHFILLIGAFAVSGLSMCVQQVPSSIYSFSEAGILVIYWQLVERTLVGFVVGLEAG